MKNIILIDKPISWTSNDVVRKIKSVYKYKKVGHAGTLDPNATGLLVIGYDEGTKLLSELILDDKQYVTTIKFGQLTNTGDSEGQIIKEETSNIKLEDVKHALQWFIDNEYYQKPHPFSAIKINGVRAYELARQNKEVDLPARLVKINKIELNDFDESNQIATITLNVSKGFYVRSFANDLANKLNTIGYVTTLRRTKCGQFDIKNAYTLREYLEQYENSRN